ncbi:MAG: hypothetical protein WD906_06485 [Anaerolineales bacterium]
MTRNTSYPGRPLLVGLIVLAALAPVSTAFASSSSTIDFEALAEGMIVGLVSAGAGISGDDAGGSVAVFGFNPEIPASNTAAIFDATCTGGCTGGDDDLFQPDLGLVLIIAENLRDEDPADGLLDRPDDADVAGAYWDFDFSGWGPGVVTIDQLTILDVERDEPGGFIEVFLGGASQGTVPLPVTGDGGRADVAVGLSGDFMRIFLGGSAAVDNIEITAEEEDGGQGCTPGFWKNHPEAWTTYTPDQTVGSVFSVPADLSALADDSLLMALQYGGGQGAEGGAQILLRAAVAALLNSESSDVDYPLTTGEVIDQVNDALASLDKETMVSLAEQLDGFNNLGSPFCD